LDKLRVAVIGLGEFGELQTSVLSGLPNAEVVAVCTRREFRVKEVAKKYNVKEHYTDYRKVLQNSEIDAVTITTSEAAHKEITIAAAQNGKQILVEKPFALNIKDADEMIRAVHDAGVSCMVGHVLKFDTRYAMVNERIERGELGKVEAMYARRNTSEVLNQNVRAPAIEDAGTHDIDIMLWYAKDKVERVFAESANPRGRPFDNVMAALMKFRNGAIGIVESFDNLPHSTPFPFPVVDAQMEVIGSSGSAYIDLSTHNLTFCGTKGVERPDTIYWPTLRNQSIGCVRELMTYFVSCIAQGKKFELNTLEEARQSLEVVLAAIKSAQTGEPVNLPFK
jgi:predicted dehydrogenase